MPAGPEPMGSSQGKNSKLKVEIMNRNSFTLLPLVLLGLVSSCRSAAPPEPEPAYRTRSADLNGANSQENNLATNRANSPVTSAPSAAPSAVASAADSANSIAAPGTNADAANQPDASVANANASPVNSSAAIASAAPAHSSPGLVASASLPVPVAAPKVASVPVSPDDPLHGEFSLADAQKGLPGKGSLQATIETSEGTMSCDLFDDRAPITVANFVGLARGLRPFKETNGTWAKRPAYDGTTFHRIIKGFMIQGGDPKGTGNGEPGYVIPDEIWEGARHNRRGYLCMANRGPNTNGMQFFILDGDASYLDGKYTIFGDCGPASAIEKLASAPVQGDRAVDPPKIKKISIKRKPKLK